MIIKSQGLQRLFYNGSDENICESIQYHPNQIKIENVIIPTDNEVYSTGLYNFLNIENTIEISLEESLKSLACLFYSCSQINEIDLSNYDAINITNMKFMFFYCSSLTSIKFGDFKTNYVEDMSFMFTGCSELQSLDISKFNTEKLTHMRIMFGSCTSLVSIDLSNLITSNVEDMGYLFFQCSNLKSINLTNKFSTQSVRDMDFMFSGCSSLELLDLSGFNTYQVKNMNWMFEKCSSLINIDLSNFHTDSVENFCNMFTQCSKLSSLIISNFNTIHAINMKGMFSSCFTLTSLDLSHFKTDNLVDIAFMFYECRKLSFVNLSSFETSKVLAMEWLFAGCWSLTSIEITNFKTSKVEHMSYMFADCPLIKSLDLSNFDTSSCSYFDGMFNKCTSLTSLDLKKFNTSKALNMDYMFGECISLTSLDLYNFNTENVIKMSYMFGGCKNLSYIDLSSFRTPNVNSMNDMFHECISLISLELSSFDTSSVSYFNGMFYRCSSLVSLDLKNFNTENAIEMQWMFDECSSLISLDISSFKTNKVVNMRIMFGYCSSLTYLDLSNFETPLVVDFGWMFFDSSKLTKINLSNFNTSSANDIEYMFHGCSKLTSLDLSNFETHNVTKMRNMFYRCSSLTYLDISKFDTSKITEMIEMFALCSELKSINLSNFNTSLVNSFERMFEGCSSLTSIDLSTFVTSNVENMTSMFFNCNKVTSLDLSNFDTSRVTIMDNMLALNKNLKIINFKKLKIIQNIPSIHNFIEQSLINPVICIDDKDTFDIIVSMHECPFVNCSGNWGEKQELIEGSVNNLCIGRCLLTKNNLNADSNERCYKICSFYFYFDESSKKYFCTENLECPDHHSKLIHKKNECVKSCSDTNNNHYEYDNKCLNKCPENFIALEENGNSCRPECPKSEPFLNSNELKCTLYCTIKERQNKVCKTNYIPKKEDNINIFEIILGQIRQELFNNFDPTTVDGTPIQEKSASITITRKRKASNSANDINLGECEDRLKEYYHIEDDLYLLRIDIQQKGSAYPIKEYEVLYPIDGPNLKKLNMSICKDVKVDVEISPPHNISNDDVDKYNPSSPYYNDICCITDSEDGTDISLSDRKEEYVNKNLSLCEIGCEFVNFNPETQKAICSCGIKTEISPMDGEGFSKDALMKGFTDINNIANVKMMTCYNTVFHKKYILKNLGFFIFGAIIALNLIFLFLFLTKYYNELYKEIEKIKKNKLKNIQTAKILNQRNRNLLNNLKQIKKRKRAKPNKRKKNIKQIINNIKSKRYKNINQPAPHKIKNQININNNKTIYIIKTSSNLKKSFSRKNLVKYNKKIKNQKFVLLNKDKINNKFKFFTIKGPKASKQKLNILELNSMSFKEALVNDKRTFFDFYFSLLKLEHSLLYLFYTEDNNCQIIKLSIFFFNFASDIAINALFYNDSTMHKIYTDHGSYNIIYKLPQVMYSMIISGVLNGIIKVLGLSQKIILNFKREKNLINDINKKAIFVYRILKINFAFFYLIIFVLLVMFWYYVACFCGIYRNTQMHLIKDSLCSFSTSLLTPFAINILPGFLRIFALKKKYKCLYILSNIF